MDTGGLDKEIHRHESCCWGYYSNCDEEENRLIAIQRDVESTENRIEETIKSIDSEEVSLIALRSAQQDSQQQQSSDTS